MTRLIKSLLSAFILLAFSGLDGEAATITAADCTQAAVQAAINAAVASDVVLIPNGTCAWSGGVAISGITLMGATQGGVTINGGSISITKHATRVTRFSNFVFRSGGPYFSVTGSITARAYVID